MPFGIPSEDFCGGFGIPDEDKEVECVEEDRQESLLTQILIDAGVTQILIDAGVTWSTRGVARALIARGVRVIRK